MASDILQQMHDCSSADNYVEVLKQRIEKWRIFFEKAVGQQLSDRMVIGLWGELNLIHELQNEKIMTAEDLWNGPLKSAQDFQGNEIAIEAVSYTHLPTAAKEVRRVSLPCPCP